MEPAMKRILILCPCLCTYNLCTLQTTSSHYIPPRNICSESLWSRSQRRINLRWTLRAVWTEKGSAGLLARRSRWCAPSGMMTATVDLERLYSTPPLDQGSSRPLLRKTANNTVSWTALLCNRGSLHGRKINSILWWLQVGLEPLQRPALSSSELLHITEIQNVQLNKEPAHRIYEPGHSCTAL